MSQKLIPSADELLRMYNRLSAANFRPAFIPENAFWFVNDVAISFDISINEAAPIVAQMIKIAMGEYEAEVSNNQVVGQIMASLKCSEETIAMPVSKNELMLIAICIREYRSYLFSIERREGKKAWTKTLIDQCNALEQKVLSNEISHDSIFGRPVLKIR
jgi:hypothetical protein